MSVTDDRMAPPPTGAERGAGVGGPGARPRGGGPDYSAGIDAGEEGTELREEMAAAPAGEHLEAGPRRGLLLSIAAGAGAMLLWMLFRAVPDEAPGDRDGRAGPTAAVEAMANEADPGWMRPPETGSGEPAGSGMFVPPVYDPAGAGEGDTAVVGDPADGPAPGAGPMTPEEDPRRAAFLAALRSRPQLGTGAIALADPAGPATQETTARLPEPDLAALQAAAEAEAVRRSAAPGESPFRAGDPAAAPASGLPAAARPSRSSYVTGGGGSTAPVPASQPLAPRGGPGGAAVVPVGTVIEGQLHTRIRSDLPGGVIGMVTRDVYDAAQRVVVIPRHSWLFGTYESDVVPGQNRLVVRWTAIRFPDGATYDLPALGTADRTGASGLPADVDNHYPRVFGQALLSSVIAAGFDRVGGDDAAEDERTWRGAMADATARELGRTAAELTRRNLDIKPTLTTRAQVVPFSILLDRDLIFTPPAGR